VHVHTPVAAFATRSALDFLRHEQKVQVLYTAHGFHFHPMGCYWQQTVRGTTELLGQNAGVLVDVGDIDQLAQAMRLVIDDTTAAAVMGQAGRRQSEAYDLTHILRMHEELYEEALGLRRSTNCNCSQCSVVQM
jgi:glycosyltransferase involved in cell wall biosynthesis